MSKKKRRITMMDPRRFRTVGKRSEWKQKLIDLRVHIRHRYFPTKPNRVWFGVCKLRSKPMVLHYGGGIEHGVAYQWLGLKISVGRTHHG